MRARSLSDRYRPLDHDEILERVLPALGEFDLADIIRESLDGSKSLG